MWTLNVTSGWMHMHQYQYLLRFGKCCCWGCVIIMLLLLNFFAFVLQHFTHCVLLFSSLLCRCTTEDADIGRSEITGPRRGSSEQQQATTVGESSRSTTCLSNSSRGEWAAPVHTVLFMRIIGEEIRKCSGLLLRMLCRVGGWFGMVLSGPSIYVRSLVFCNNYCGVLCNMCICRLDAFSVPFPLSVHIFLLYWSHRGSWTGIQLIFIVHWH